VRALAEAALATGPVTFDATPWDAALWHCARHGLRTGLLHPLTGQASTADAVLKALRDRVAAHVADDGELDAVERLLTTAVSRGNGATRQRSAKRRGIPALAELYRRCLVGDEPVRPGAPRPHRMSTPSAASAPVRIVAAGHGADAS
jgi:hypothetical protein